MSPGHTVAVRARGYGEARDRGLKQGVGDTAMLPEACGRVLLPTALLLHEYHSSAQRAAMAGLVPPPSRDPLHSLLSTVGSAEPLCTPRCQSALVPQLPPPLSCC